MAVATMVITGAVVAATRSSDEQALQPTRHSASRAIERKVDALRQMTVQEKLQQVQLLSDGQITDEDAKAASAACSA